MRLSEKHRLMGQLHQLPMPKGQKLERAVSAQPQQATIQCKFINQIKPGGKFGSIKDSTDNMWWTNDSNILARLVKGQQITVRFTHQQWGKGADAKTVNVIEEVLDEAPRTQGTQAPEPIDSLDVSARMFAYNYLASIYHGTGTFPGAEILQKQLYATRCAYHTAFGRPVSIMRSNEPPAVPVPTPEKPAQRQNYQAHDPDGRGDAWEAPAF